MAAVAYKLNDLVWAKMKGFSPWPGRVALPTHDLKQPPKKNVSVQCIYFFGSNNYAWIEEPNIKPYQEHKETLIKSCKTAAFKEAVAQIEEYIVDPEKFGPIDGVRPDAEEEFDKLKEAIAESEEASAKAASTPKPKKAESSSGEKSIKRVSTSSKSSVPRKKSKNNSNNSFHYDSLNSSSFKKSSYTLLDRPANIVRPETPPLDLERITDTLKGKNIYPSELKFGFLGLGIMGSGIVKNLLNSGHKVTIWNRTANKCKEFEKIGASIAVTPCDVVDEADIIFSCVADPQAAKEMIFGNCGVLHSQSLQVKGYVEMTTIDSDTSHDIVEALNSKGARYLEAQIQGSKTEAEEGTLIILAAGDRTLFDDCQSCFEAMSKNSFYLGDIGNASKMNLVLQLINGVVLAGLAEGMALADRAGLNQKDLLEVLGLTNLSCPTIIQKGKAMVDCSYSTHQPLSHMQKDLKLALSMGDVLEQSLPLTATTNEIFKHAKHLGYAGHDSSAVYIRARF